jgi:hypothetical protein
MRSRPTGEKGAKNTPSLSPETNMCSYQPLLKLPTRQGCSSLCPSVATMAVHPPEGPCRTSFFFLSRRALNLSILFFTEQMPSACSKSPRCSVALSTLQNPQTDVLHFPAALHEHLVQALSSQQSKFSPNLKPMAPPPQFFKIESLR